MPEVRSFRRLFGAVCTVVDSELLRYLQPKVDTFLPCSGTVAFS